MGVKLINEWLLKELELIDRGDRYVGFNGTKVRAFQLDFETEITVNLQLIPNMGLAPIQKLAKVSEWLVWVDDVDFPFVLNDEDFEKTYEIQ